MDLGDVKRGLAAITRIGTDVDRKSWPLITYLPFLWRPEQNVPLEPTAATGFARRVGHRFAHKNAPDIRREN